MGRKFDVSLLPSAPTLEYEEFQRAAGFSNIAGIDEAGRGALAGPVVAAAFILPQKENLFQELHGVRDSKQMTYQQREKWFEYFHKQGICFGVSFVSAEKIDEIGILPSTRMAMIEAYRSLSISPDFLLIDAVKLPEIKIAQQSLVKGDQRSLSIACASIVAKVSRDRYMEEQGKIYPQYGFERHKGYGTKKHRAAISTEIGYCPIHRKTFSPLKEILNPKMNKQISFE
ncbi:MAG: ribonuclease HII [Anaerolineales bacterium]|nr:ribonuclease HII [Anaerolineales bacterium]